MTKQEIEKRIEQLEAQRKDVKGEKCEVYSRVVGYLRPVNQWNSGKQEEFEERKVFKTQ